MAGALREKTAFAKYMASIMSPQEMGELKMIEYQRYKTQFYHDELRRVRVNERELEEKEKQYENESPNEDSEEFDEIHGMNIQRDFNLRALCKQALTKPMFYVDWIVYFVQIMENKQEVLRHCKNKIVTLWEEIDKLETEGARLFMKIIRGTNEERDEAETMKASNTLALNMAKQDLDFAVHEFLKSF